MSNCTSSLAAGDITKIRVGLTPAPCLRRVKRLESDGVILGYTARINPTATGRGFEVRCEGRGEVLNERDGPKPAGQGHRKWGDLVHLLVEVTEVLDVLLEQHLFSVEGVVVVRL